MEHIEIELKDLFRNPTYLALILNKLNKEKLYALIECSFITLLRLYLNGKDIDFSKPKEFTDVINRIWKNVEKELLLSYNRCGK